MKEQLRSLNSTPEDTIEFEAAEPTRQRRCLRFEIASQAGLPYEIFVSLPRQAPPPEGFPVLYMLDANADFTLADQVMERLTRRPAATGVEPAIIVGIGYPQTEGYNQERRHLDLTSGPTDDAFYEDTTYTFGGQHAFIAFICDRLKPVIRNRFPIREGHETILGHSLGGYFVVELALTRPELFSGYVAISPSIWWNPDRIFGHIASRSAPPEKPIRFFLAAGGWETEPAPWQRQDTPERNLEQTNLRLRRRMNDNIDRLSECCRSTYPETVTLRTERIADEDHSSIYVASLPRALRFVLPAGQG
ncbi:alpha/beta hydrolase [Martelella endophytica]|uniref:alpha/beta hydrolase n=1 Tax=Martelella endophytica TaxID=1486262 RepID=UPI00130E7356|nr:alpha/beta hydrolase-fold protein [Martelella endophytica]